MVTLGSDKTMSIPGRHMTYFRKEFCNSESAPEDIIELVKAAGGGTPEQGFFSSVDETPVLKKPGFRDNFNTALRHANEVSYPWCKAGAGAGWDSFEPSAGEPGYMLDRRLSSLGLAIFGLTSASVNGTFSLCEHISNVTNQAAKTLSEDIGMMLIEEKAKNGISISKEDRDKLGKKADQKAKEAFNSMLMNCRTALENMEYGEREYVGFNKLDKAVKADAEELCEEALRMVLPAEKKTEVKKAEPSLDSDEEDFFKQNGAIAKDANVAPGIKKMRERFHLYLGTTEANQLRWNDWVRYQEFCVPTTAEARAVNTAKAIGGALAVGAIYFFRQGLKGLAVAFAGSMADIAIAPMDKFATAVSKWIKKHKDRNGPDEPPVAGGAEAPEAAVADELVAEEAADAVDVGETDRVMVPEIDLGFRPAIGYAGYQLYRNGPAMLNAVKGIFEGTATGLSTIKIGLPFFIGGEYFKQQYIDSRIPGTEAYNRKNLL